MKENAEMSGEDELVGIGVALFIVAGVMFFAMSGTTSAAIAGVDARQVVAALGEGLRSLLGITGL